MKKELPVWLIAFIIVVAILVIGAIFWRTMKPLPEVTPTPEQEAAMEAAKAKAFGARTREELEKLGSKIVPSPYAPKSTQGR